MKAMREEIKTAEQIRKTADQLTNYSKTGKTTTNRNAEFSFKDRETKFYND